MRERPEGGYPKQPGALRRFNRWFWEDLVLEAVGEAVVAMTACLLFVGTVFAVIWGYERAPKSTVALGLALTAFLFYGLLLLTGRGRGTKGKLATVAMAFCLVVGIWATYVLQYCACL